MSPPPAQHVIMPCPDCGQRMAVQADAADGDVLTCPHCSREFAVRYRAETIPARDTVDDALRGASRSAAATAADLPERPVSLSEQLPAKTGPEQDVLTLKPSLIRSNPAAYLGLWALVIAGCTLTVLALMRNVGPYIWLPCVVLFAAGALPLLVWKLRTMHSYVRITNKRIIDSDGFFRKTTSEILHRDIRNVRVEQSLLERITNSGTLSIYTSSDEVPEVHMAHVPRPDKVREVIDTYRNL